ncbi:MAG: response regulator [Pseudomonadota bacterium]
MGQEISNAVHIVDDDPAVRHTIATILRAAGFSPHQYATADELLGTIDSLEPGCIITDVNMPGLSGIELLLSLKESGVELPVIVISGQADIPMAVEAIKAGAVEFLEKPLHSDTLRAAVQGAALRHTPTPADETIHYVRIVESLTRRQREVLAGILDGQPNKIIAYQLGLSIRTVEAYRAAIMERTRARNLSELVRMGIKAGL